MMDRLTKQQRQALFQAMLKGFSPSELEMLLFINMGVSSFEVTSASNNHRKTVMDTIAWAKRQDRIYELVREAHLANPGNQQLHEIAIEIGVAIDAPPKARLERLLEMFGDEFRVPEHMTQREQFEQMLQIFARELDLHPRFETSLKQRAGNGQQDKLERVIRPSTPVFDVVVLQHNLQMAARRVCRIERNAQPLGTGFLVGPNLVLTAGYVVEGLYKGGAHVDDFACRFDYLVTADQQVNAGIAVSLGQDWLVDYAPYSKVDMSSNSAELPKPDELSYALLSLAENVGEDRGWFSLRESPDNVALGSSLTILQHIKGTPQKVALVDNSVSQYNSNRTRLYYHNETGPGSSGAPCLDMSFKAVAMHSGVKRGIDGKNHYQFGIPLKAVVDLLDQRGFGDLIN